MKEDIVPVLLEPYGFLSIKQMVTENGMHDSRNVKMYTIGLEDRIKFLQQQKNKQKCSNFQKERTKETQQRLKRNDKRKLSEQN